MNEISSNHIIQSLQKKWSLQNLITCFVIAIAVAIFLLSIIVELLHASWLFVLPVLLLSITITFVFFIKKIEAADVIRFLNKTFPDLQESTHLILKPTDSLNGLEKLQRKKIESQLSAAMPAPLVLQKRLKVSAILLVTALLFALGLSFISFRPVRSSSLHTNTKPSFISTKPEKKLPEIKEVNIKIIPPSYTGKQAREQDKFNIIAEQKATVTWMLTTTKEAQDVQLIFNDKTVLHLHATGKEATQWTTSKLILQPGFYQVNIDNKLSELYQVEMIRDEPPVIMVQSPKPNLFIKWGEPQKINITASVTDDYGIDSTFIQATTASGSGEAVKFTEHRFLFSNFSSGSRHEALQKMIDLPLLGMTPGDELYFYITATDNNRQQKRSDVFIVRLEDTAQLFSMTGLATGIDVKPELFRSERQIIIETEQLLKDKDTINEDEFKKRSANLGSDQELLRLRYGKYLGEETETEIGGQHEKDEPVSATDFGNADKVIDQFSHKHDIAEDADFFDAPTKKQLQAMLTEMWKASLQLKTYKPKDALPFEYNALRLLKDLQQKTRAYVAKAGFQTTPLNPGKRLTGDLDKIIQPVIKENAQQKASSLITLRKAIGILEKVRNKEALQKTDLDVFDEASTQLSAAAALHPAAYLQAYEAFGRVVENKARLNDVNLAGNALQKMITSVANVPQQTQSSPDMNLSKRYFMNLNKRND